MGGPTVLWRDASALALSLLLWGRGIEALLCWQGGNGGAAAPAVVVEVVFDPRGPAPLRVGLTRAGGSRSLSLLAPSCNPRLPAADPRDAPCSS